MLGRGTTALMALGLLLAGCLGTDANDANDDNDGHDGDGSKEALQAAQGAWAQWTLTDEPLPAFELAATGCIEGGGHSVHPLFLNPLPEPWLPADVIEDVGPQLVYSEIPDPFNPVPTEGNTMGNYHATVLCDGWTLNGEAKDPLLFGFVGMKVQTPPWATDTDVYGEPSHEYLVSVIATDDDEVHELLVGAGVNALKATGHITPMGAESLFVEMDTDHNGAYDSLFVPKHLGPMQAHHVRLWFLHPVGSDGAVHHGDDHEGGFSPVSVDLVTDRAGEHYGAEGQGYFSHTGTGHHGPQGGAHGHTAALYYEDFDRTVLLGPQFPNVVLDDWYDH